MIIWKKLRIKQTCSSKRYSLCCKSRWRFQYVAIVPYLNLNIDKSYYVFYLLSILYTILVITFISNKLRYLLLSDILHFKLVYIYYYHG